MPQPNDNQSSITSITRRSTGMYLVKASCGSSFTIDETLLVQLQIRVGALVDDEIRAKLDEGAQRSAARRTALRYLTTRPRSEYEVRARLRKADISSKIEDEVIEWLIGLGYIDDDRFAVEWVRYRSMVKKVGSQRLKHELQQKGVTKRAIGDALATLSYDDEFSLALQSAKKRSTSLQNLELSVAKRRLTAYLQRRGFNFEIIRQVISQVLP